MSGFELSQLPLAGLTLVKRNPFSDSRGAFARLFCAETMVGAGWTGGIVQVNYSATSNKGTVRGMHYQIPPHAEAKLVSCLHGEIFDVAVDLRAGSPTFLQWYGTILSGANNMALLIPPGFAHGFQALTDDVEMIYCHSKDYVPEFEAGLQALDPKVAIAWPEPITNRSERDSALGAVLDNFEGIRL